MTAYVARRTLLAEFTMVVVSFFSLAIIKLPAGDYVNALSRDLELWTRRRGHRP